MNTFNQVIAKIMNATIPMPVETVSLLASANRVLQENIMADIHMPPFNKSAMDGYACRMADLELELQLIEIIQAGKLPQKTIAAGQCSKIMTGAAVPQGADCVFMMEDAHIMNEQLVKCTNLNTKKNICYKGEDYQNGDVLLEKGILLSAAHIGIIASAGYSEVQVSKLPSIAIIATGTELVEPEVKPEGGQIRNSNSYQLMAQCAELGIRATYVGILPDELDTITKVFEKSMKENDIVIITGGASNSDFDFVSHVLTNQNFEIIVEKTNMQPGNPMTFSRKEAKFCFGLSGNPVSSLVQFEILVKPFIQKLLGSNKGSLRIEAKLKNDFIRKKANRFGIFPVKLLDDNWIEEIDYHGSAHINAFALANVLMEVPEGISLLKKNETVYVRPI